MDDAMSADRGSVSVEVAILAPAFIALLVLAGVAGRTAVAAEAVDTAAHDAARAASISRDSATARRAAENAAVRQLDWRGLDCTGRPAVTFSGVVDGHVTSLDAAFRSPVGRDASVTVRISCAVDLSELRLPVVPGMPTGKQVTADFTSPLDRYRSRG
ncbi:TadE/TadG family type IV pilus assembly protein [Micromonospora sp. WMMA1363]|uniref:TadE/TadG family type IV pilus assembly protein n=1 Tax=Micromonospora sp. WMMA1363 TaxID=3053985 RepID=UPI00259CB240|nr:TadE/TadG family type IV pilus assembly protein [Micromonospora sp. WMMA1363]MDM4721944.1 TadE/TadG family type IV pilus assembly protein [Micromonospora sp. WMMA1363]